MKRVISGCLVMWSFWCAADVGSVLLTEGGSPWSTEIQNPNERVWRRVSTAMGADGRVQSRTNSVYEVGTGLAYWDGTQYQPSREVLEVVGNEAMGLDAAHKVILSGDANVQGSLDVQLPNDAGRLMSTVFGINLFDPKTGASLLIAQLQNAQGQVAARNRVVYPSAMDTINAEVSVSFHKWGIEQFVTLQERFDLPDGFNPETSLIEVWTEFFNPPAPKITKRLVNGLENSFVDFGSMQMGPAGKAFAVNVAGSEKWNTRVYKSWHVIDGRTFLLEAVRWKDVAPYIAQLPVGKGQAMLRQKALQFAGPTLRDGNLPARQFAKKSEDVMRYAAAGPTKPGLVVDFSLVQSTNEMVLEGGKTWFVSSALTVSNLVIEPTAVVKYTNGAYIEVLGSVQTKTEPYAPAIFTSYLDSSVGETISTNAAPAHDGGAALIVSTANNMVEHVRFSYFDTAILLLGGDTTFKHAMFTHCGTALAEYGVEAKVLNGLFFDVSYLLDGSDYSFTGEHVTVDRAVYIATLSSGTNAVYLTNTIAAAITNLGSGTFYTNKFVRVADSSCFKTVGGSSHYLADGSAYRDIGVATSIDSEIRSRTTYGPVEHAVPTMITNQNVTLATTAQRDSDGQPDLGWHAAPVDHVYSATFISNAVVTVTPGTVVATYTQSPYLYGFLLGPGGNLICEGSPTDPARLVRFSTVQELANTNWSGPHGPQVYAPADAPGQPPECRFRFTEFSVLANEAYHIYGAEQQSNMPPIRLVDSALRGAGIYTQGPSFAITNTLFERCSSFLLSIGLYPFASTFQNALFIGGDLSYSTVDTNEIVVHDTLFDGTALSMADNVNSHNGYIVGGDRLSPTNTHDVLLTTVAYERGPLGRYYIPTNSPLVDAGSSTNAAQKGFYWHTSFTNQTVEATSPLNIGKLWIAVSPDGNPLDSDGDGDPNYLEDANGNGAVDSGETDWNSATDQGLRIIITHPLTGSMLP